MPSHQSLVSVIIPFLNPGPWLSLAIESVLSQTYSNWEIILINDGSVEADSLVAQGYAERFPDQIFYIAHDGSRNKGVTASRNLGISKSRGEYLAFLDADDCWMPLKLERQLALFKNISGIQMVCQASVFWYSWENAGKDNYIQLLGAPAGTYAPTQLIPLLYPFGKGQPPCPSGIMIKKDALTRNGGFDESFRGMFQLYEDQAFLFKIYCNEFVYISDDADNYYRKRKDSLSSAANDQDLYLEVRVFFAQWVKEYLAKNSPHDPMLDSLLLDFTGKLKSSAIT